MNEEKKLDNKKQAFFCVNLKILKISKNIMTKRLNLFNFLSFAL